MAQPGLSFTDIWRHCLYVVSGDFFDMLLDQVELKIETNFIDILVTGLYRNRAEKIVKRYSKQLALKNYSGTTYITSKCKGGRGKRQKI